MAVPDLDREPAGVGASMIPPSTDHLGEADRRLLLAAILQGPEF